MGIFKNKRAVVHFLKTLETIQNFPLDKLKKNFKKYKKKYDQNLLLKKLTI